MRSIIIRFLKYGVLASVMLFAGIVAWLLTLDINQYKPLLVQAVSSATGREIRIEGDLQLSPSLMPIISAQAISLANASWSESGRPLATVGKVEARAALVPLLSGELRILDFTLADVKLSLETDATGQGNWLFANDVGPNDPVADTGSARLPPITIQQITLNNVELIYTAWQTPSQQISLHELTGELKDLDSPLDIQLKASWQQQGLDFSGTVGSVNHLLENTNYPLNLQGRVAGILDVQVNGTVTRPLEFERFDLDISLSAQQLTDLNALTGQQLPSIGPVTLGGKFAYTGSDVMLDSMTLILDQTLITGRASYALSDTPMAILDLKSDLIDLQKPEAPEEESEQTRLFPDTPLPLSALAGINLDASVQIARFKSNATVLDKLQLQIQQNANTLQAALSTGIAGGQLAGNVNIEMAGNSPSMRIKLEGTDIQLGQMPHDVNKPWFSGGPMLLQLDGTSHGLSPAELAANYTGKFLVKVGEATMPNTNVDLFGADVLMSVFNRVNPLTSREKTSLLECAVVNLQVKDGIAAIDRQIAIQTSKMVMTGSGEIKLGTEQLNLGIRPYAREGIGISLGDMAGFVRIGGTLVKPQAEVDTQGAVKTGIAAGAAVATGGLSLLAQGLYNRNTRDAAPCETAMMDNPSGSVSTSPSSESGSASKPGGIINNVKSGLKKLFGN